jgi:hypothetical protein
MGDNASDAVADIGLSILTTGAGMIHPNLIFSRSHAEVENDELSRFRRSSRRSYSGRPHRGTTSVLVIDCTTTSTSSGHSASIAGGPAPTGVVDSCQVSAGALRADPSGIRILMILAADLIPPA